MVKKFMPDTTPANENEAVAEQFEQAGVGEVKLADGFRHSKGDYITLNELVQTFNDMLDAMPDLGDRKVAASLLAPGIGPLPMNLAGVGARFDKETGAKIVEMLFTPNMGDK